MNEIVQQNPQAEVYEAINNRIQFEIVQDVYDEWMN